MKLSKAQEKMLKDLSDGHTITFSQGLNPFAFYSGHVGWSANISTLFALIKRNLVKEISSDWSSTTYGKI